MLSCLSVLGSQSKSQGAFFSPHSRDFGSLALRLVRCVAGTGYVCRAETRVVTPLFWRIIRCTREESQINLHPPAGIDISKGRAHQAVGFRMKEESGFLGVY